MLNNLLLLLVENIKPVVNIKLVVVYEAIGVRVAFLHSFHEPENVM